MTRTKAICVASLLAACALSGCSGSARSPGQAGPVTGPIQEEFTELAPPELPGPLPDPTNAYLDDPRAAVLGKKFFFDPRFSGALLDPSNNGGSDSLGMVGDTGKVSCSGCHLPGGAFSDFRSSRGQISLGAAWGHRKALSLLDVGERQLLNWDGRRDAQFAQPFTPIEDPNEFNSSRLYVAQQMQRLYKQDYEALFGPLPSLDRYAVLAPADAGCNEIDESQVHGTCKKDGFDDDDVTRVVVNMGKAIQAFLRQVSCGPSRFDAWVNGQEGALTQDEQAGAHVFIGKGRCVQCHNGPSITDNLYHNVGVHPDFTFFVVPIYDGGAADGLAGVLNDPLNSKGKFSDGYDGRLDNLQPLETLVGAFRTPSLRCVNRRPSFMHTGQLRSLEDVVAFFNHGGDSDGYPGTSENFARGLTHEERDQLVAFLRALDGEGPAPELIAPPDLPPDPVN